MGKTTCQLIHRPILTSCQVRGGWSTSAPPFEQSPRVIYQWYQPPAHSISFGIDKQDTSLSTPTFYQTPTRLPPPPHPRPSQHDLNAVQATSKLWPKSLTGLTAAALNDGQSLAHIPMAQIYDLPPTHFMCARHM
ncbi:hypothetical protein TcWFU_009308 [Taenia crassiceps]|uniref:Uncharacterized protein n=1 Tax=Taenia crassiceps TaxID=6207 RepID=A0ABR4QVH6_9CEST